MLCYVEFSMWTKGQGQGDILGVYERKLRVPKVGRNVQPHRTGGATVALSPWSPMYSLQLCAHSKCALQKSATFTARTILQTPKSNHFTPFLKILQQLPIVQTSELTNKTLLDRSLCLLALGTPGMALSSKSSGHPSQAAAWFLSSTIRCPCSQKMSTVALTAQRRDSLQRQRRNI